MTTRLLVTAPGLSAQAVATTIDGFPPKDIPARHLGKGVYFRLTGRAPFEHLIYPPPIPGALGTHYRRISAARRCSVPTSPMSRPRTIRSTPPAPPASTTTCATSGLACPTAP